MNIYSIQNPEEKHKTAEAAKPLGHSDYHKYEDPSGDFTAKELNYSVWYVRHKVLLYDLLIGGLIVFSAVTLVLSGGRWLYYFVVGREADKQLYAELARPVNYLVFHPRIEATPLVVNSTVILPAGVNKYSVVAQAFNPNPRFVARFKYFFVVDGVKGPEMEEFMLPQEVKPLTYLGIESATAPAGAVLAISDMRWQRVSAREIPNIEAWQAERLNFAVDAFSFAPANSADGIPVNRTTFSMVNNSAYGYKAPAFYAGLYSGESLVGLLPFALPDFPSLTSSTVDLRDFVQNLSVTSVKVFPRINIFDPEVYLPPPR